MSRSEPIVPGDGDPRHGTVNGYTNLKCRCDKCKQAIRDQKAAGLPDPEDPRHGTASGYVNNGCRCARCTEAQRADCERRRRGIPAKRFKKVPLDAA